MFDNKKSESCIPALNSQSCSMTGKAGQVEPGDDDYEAATEKPVGDAICSQLHSIEFNV